MRLRPYLLFAFTPLLSYPQENAPDGNTNPWKEIYEYVADQYGLDQVLVNGVYYEEDFRGSEGHPFLLENQFHKGTLVFRNKEYKGVNLKYDIYKQQVILYINQRNSIAWIIPPNDFITAFSIGEKHFRKHTFSGVPEFYQEVFNTQKLKCYYYWSKRRYDSDHKGEYNSSKYTGSERKSYLMTDGTIKQFRNNSSFARLFPEDIQPRIMTYIKQIKIKVGSCSDDEIHALLSYCNTLL